MGSKLEDGKDVGDAEIDAVPADDLHIGLDEPTGEMAIILTSERLGFALSVSADVERAIQIRDWIDSLINKMDIK